MDRSIQMKWPQRSRRMPSGDSLVEASTLESIVGAVSSTHHALLQSNGYSGSSLERIHVSRPDGTRVQFVLKRTIPAEDWTCRLSGASRSREALLLEADELRDVWRVFRCPYVAYSDEADGSAAFLMQDLTEFLLPDVREPLAEAQQQLLLQCLASLHAHYWQQDALDLPWLAPASMYCSILGADRFSGAAIVECLGVLPQPMEQAVISGWKRVLERVPARTAKALQTPGADLAQLWIDLPRTLVHGDVKVANFAMHADGSVGAFDWAWAGWAPASVDLGWYLAVNASRLTRSKEAFVRDYRLLLESQLRESFDERAWDEFENAAILIGARMLLWSKANALANGGTQAAQEWQWWLDRVVSASERI